VPQQDDREDVNAAITPLPLPLFFQFSLQEAKGAPVRLYRCQSTRVRTLCRTESLKILRMQEGGPPAGDAAIADRIFWPERK